MKNFEENLSILLKKRDNFQSFDEYDHKYLLGPYTYEVDYNWFLGMYVIG